MASELRLLEHGMAVSLHLEASATGWDHLHSRIRECRLDLGRQTGGPWFVASDRAVLDGDDHRLEKQCETTSAIELLSEHQLRKAIARHGPNKSGRQQGDRIAYLLLSASTARVHDATGRRRTSRSAAWVAQTVPIGHRVQRQRPGALRLISPERPNREQHDMPVAERRVDDGRLALHVLWVVQHPRDA